MVARLLHTPPLKCQLVPELASWGIMVGAGIFHRGSTTHLVVAEVQHLVCIMEWWGTTFYDLWPQSSFNDWHFHMKFTTGNQRSTSLWPCFWVEHCAQSSP